MSTEALRLCWENVTSSKPAIVVNSSRDSNRILSKDRHSPTTRKCPNELQCRRWRSTRGIGGLDRLHGGRASGSVLLHCRKMAANQTQHVNNFLSFTILQLVISEQTPLFVLVSLPFLPPSSSRSSSSRVASPEVPTAFPCQPSDKGDLDGHQERWVRGLCYPFTNDLPSHWHHPFPSWPKGRRSRSNYPPSLLFQTPPNHLYRSVAWCPCHLFRCYSVCVCLSCYRFNSLSTVDTRCSTKIPRDGFNPGQNLLRQIAKMPVFSCHPGKNWNLRQMNARFPPSPYPKLFRIAWQLYMLAFRPRQLWIGGGEGVYVLCLGETGVGRKS